jgi:hypothetical protein
MFHPPTIVVCHEYGVDLLPFSGVDSNRVTGPIREHILFMMFSCCEVILFMMFICILGEASKQKYKPNAREEGIQHKYQAGSSGGGEGALPPARGDMEG